MEVYETLNHMGVYCDLVGDWACEVGKGQLESAKELSIALVLMLLTEP
jgi:hypothetical protein